jgi:hypothetical protein
MRPLVTTGLPLAIMLAGCNVQGTDWTDQNRDLDAGQTVTVQIEIKRDWFVADSSIKVRALVDGKSYPLSRQPTGIWSAKLPAACKITPLNYSYQVDWSYRTFGTGGSETKTIPATGTLQAKFKQPPPVQMPSELRLYGTRAISRAVVLKSMHPAEITLSNISIGPWEGRCPVGNCTGKAFTLSDVPALPHGMSCGSTTQFNVDFASTVQSAGVLTVTTDQGTVQIPMNGRISLLQ